MQSVMSNEEQMREARIYSALKDLTGTNKEITAEQRRAAMQEVRSAISSGFLKADDPKVKAALAGSKEAKAKGGKIKGYAYGTPKGGVKKMSSCRGRKAQGNKD